MSAPLVALLMAATLVLWVPTLCFVLEVLFALLPARTEAPRSAVYPPIAVLVPAHNEAPTIGSALQSIRSQLRSDDRLLVVADNCSDDTAAAAAAGGAEVIERRDDRQRGKGFALDFGVRHLAARPPAVLIVVDADCRVADGTLQRLATLCASTGRPVQARYLMYAPPGSGALRKLAQFAWLVRNEVRPSGLLRLGLPCQLMGSGMAFPWRSVAQGRLASGHLVEDLKLGVELAQAGSAPLFCPAALVTSLFPIATAGVESQRRRWEHGHLSVLLSLGPKLWWRALARRDAQALALAFDLMVPPLSLLLLLSAIVWLLDLAAWRWLGSALPGLLSSIALGALLAAVWLAWLGFGRQIVSLGTLLLAGGYALRKLPLYAGFLVARQVEWVRSRRDGEGEGEPRGAGELRGNGGGEGGTKPR